MCWAFDEVTSDANTKIASRQPLLSQKTNVLMRKKIFLVAEIIFAAECVQNLADASLSSISLISFARNLQALHQETVAKPLENLPSFREPLRRTILRAFHAKFSPREKYFCDCAGEPDLHGEPATKTPPEELRACVAQRRCGAQRQELSSPHICPPLADCGPAHHSSCEIHPPSQKSERKVLRTVLCVLRGGSFVLAFLPAARRRSRPHRRHRMHRQLRAMRIRIDHILPQHPLRVEE